MKIFDAIRKSKASGSSLFNKELMLNSNGGS